MCRERILPVFNRMVVFTASERSFHGRPEPLACPPDVTRKSLALYYYTFDSPPGWTNETQQAVWITRQGEVIPPAVPRANGPGSGGDGAATAPRESTVRTVVKKLMPPLLLDVVRRVKRFRS